MTKGTEIGGMDHRAVVDAEKYTPELLTAFLVEMEHTETSQEVWQALVRMSAGIGLPFVDFIVATNYGNWRKTLFIRTSYDSGWLNDLNKDPELQRWSYFRSHAIHHLTPIVVGLEYIDEYHRIPEKRVKVLRMAAERGIRAGFSIPLRTSAPRQTGLITYSGDYSKREFNAIIKAHGWALNTAALVAHQRYMEHFLAEFPDRNHVTAKQQELLELIGQGLQDKQIADELCISISAVRQRMSKLFEKTGVATRPELAALAMSIGILPDPMNRPGGRPQDIKIDMD